MIVNILALYLFLLASSISYWLIFSSNWIWSIAVIMCFAGSAGLFKRKSWGQYLWYLIAFIASTGWVAMVTYTLSNADNNVFQHWDQLMIALIPGLVWIFSWVAGSYVVTVQFRKLRSIDRP